MVQSAAGGMGRFAFVSQRFLDLTRLARETVTADPLSFFACIQPNDYWGWVRKSSDMFAATNLQTVAN